MNLKRVVVVTALFCFFLPSAILADSIDFDGNGTGQDPGWFWTGGANSSSSASGSPVIVFRNGIPSVEPLPSSAQAAKTRTTGGTVSGNGSILILYDWATGGTITIKDGDVVYFSGTFPGGKAAFDAVSAPSCEATEESGDSDPLILTLFMLQPGANTSLSTSACAQKLGSATIKAREKGSFRRADLPLARVPEPATLSLIGTGALGLIALLHGRRAV